MNQLQKIAIINYNSGNITSLENSLKRLNYKPKIIKNGHDLAILDDGFQDLSIYKNFNIACFNASTLEVCPQPEPNSC